jgi:hypothetical protein
LVGAALLGLAGIPLVAHAARSGPAADMRGAEAGSEKARLIERAQREYEAAAEATLGPVVGPPEERWQPEIVEGIIDSAESPFEGSSFVLTNLWQSGLSADGRVTRVYAGMDGSAALLIVLRQELQTGQRELYREIPLPSGVGTPRVARVVRGGLEVTTASGRSFELDLVRQGLR